MSKKYRKTDLRKCKKDTLVELALSEGIQNPRSLRKDQIIEALIDRDAGAVSARKPSKRSTQDRPQKKKTTNATVEEIDAFAREQLQYDEMHVRTELTGGESDDGIAYRDESARYELPGTYNTTKLVVMVRDPYWAYTYWDFAEQKRHEIKHYFERYGSNLAPVLRVHEITNVIFDGSNSNYYWDIDVQLDIKNWYLYLKEPNCVFVVDLGLRAPDGTFYLIARSNIVKTPLDRFSDVIDEQWMSTDLWEWYGAYLKSMNGISSREFAMRDVRLHLEEWITSGGASSPIKKIGAKKRDFFLEVGTELILYGRTKPDAVVTVDGEKVTLRKDGTFTLRYALPDGARTLPVIAVSQDKKDKRKITIEVDKVTDA